MSTACCADGAPVAYRSSTAVGVSFWFSAGAGGEGKLCRRISSTMTERNCSTCVGVNAAVVAGSKPNLRSARPVLALIESTVSLRPPPLWRLRTMAFVIHRDRSRPPNPVGSARHKRVRNARHTARNRCPLDTPVAVLGGNRSSRSTARSVRTSKRTGPRRRGLDPRS